ncbi:unnamed protein product [Arctogadus glacialis]
MPPYGIRVSRDIAPSRPVAQSPTHLLQVSPKGGKRNGGVLPACRARSTTAGGAGRRAVTGCRGMRSDYLGRRGMDDNHATLSLSLLFSPLLFLFPYLLFTQTQAALLSGHYTAESSSPDIRSTSSLATFKTLLTTQLFKLAVCL